METNNILREAVGYIAQYADSAAMRQHDATTQHYIEQMRKWATAALAEPVRNYEVGTVEEQFSRHDKYCNNQPDCKLCNSPAAANNCIRCYVAWAQMPYESEVSK